MFVGVIEFRKCAMKVDWLRQATADGELKANDDGGVETVADIDVDIDAMSEIVVDENQPDYVVVDNVEKVYLLGMLTLKIVENAALVFVVDYCYCPN